MVFAPHVLYFINNFIENIKKMKVNIKTDIYLEKLIDNKFICHVKI